MKTKKIPAVLAVTLLLLLLLAGTALAAPVRVNVNGEFVEFSATTSYPYIDLQSRVMIPLRGVLEKAGANVAWDNKAKTATVTKGAVQVRVPAGEKRIMIDGKEQVIDTAAVVKNGKTCLPARAVLEAIGFAVDWESTEGMVYAVNYDEWKAKYPEQESAAATVKDAIKLLKENYKGTADATLPNLAVTKITATQQLAKGTLPKGQQLVLFRLSVANQTGKDFTLTLDDFYVKSGDKTLKWAKGLTPKENATLLVNGLQLKDQKTAVGWLAFAVPAGADYELYYQQDDTVQRLQ